MKTADPLAQVMWIGRLETPAARTTERPAAGEVFYGGEVVRHNTGRVLGVR